MPDHRVMRTPLQVVLLRQGAALQQVPIVVLLRNGTSQVQIARIFSFPTIPTATLKAPVLILELQRSLLLLWESHNRVHLQAPRNLVPL